MTFTWTDRRVHPRRRPETPQQPHPLEARLARLKVARPGDAAIANRLVSAYGFSHHQALYLVVYHPTEVFAFLREQQHLHRRPLETINRQLALL